jgi:hypothetical protein
LADFGFALRTHALRHGRVFHRRQGDVHIRLQKHVVALVGLDGRFGRVHVFGALHFVGRDPHHGLPTGASHFHGHGFHQRQGELAA